FLADVLLQVIKLCFRNRPWLIFGGDTIASGRACAERAVGMRQNELPRAAADCFELGAGPLAKRHAVKEIRLVWILGSWLGSQERPDVEAVDLMIGQLGADQLGERGQEVDGHRQFVAGFASRYMAGPAGN